MYGVGLGGPDRRIDFREYAMNLDDMADQIVQEAIAEFEGPLDVLINNAGTNHMDWLRQHSADDTQDVFVVNTFMPMALVRAFLRAGDMFEPRRRTIVNTCSMGVQFGLRCCSAYVASKAALEAYTRTAAKELAGKEQTAIVGIAPMSVKPSAMDQYCQQRMVEIRDMTPEQAAAYSQQSPMGPSTHDDIAELFMWCATKMPLHFSGSIFRQGGGMGLFT